MATRRDQLVGNKLALAGAIIYLLEWAVIIPSGGSGPAEPGTSPAAVVKLYTDAAGTHALFATYFSLVLLGRIAYVAGVRGAFRRSPSYLPLKK